MATRVITKLDSVSFDTLLGQQTPFLVTEPVFDLTTVTLITPSPVVQIAASCHALAAVGRVPTVKVGSDLVRSYLARCGFFQVVEGVSRSEPEMGTRQSFVYTARHGSSPMLIEVTQLQDGSALPDLLDKIVWVLRRKLKYRKYDAFDIATVVSELCQNTFDHNVGTSGFVAMQVYGKGRKRFLEAAVSDFGAGLLTTLKRNPGNAGLRTDLDAVKAAMQLGISEHNDPTRGAGLYHLLEITYKHQGCLQIKSGGSKVRYRMDKRQGWAFSVPAIPGVHIAVDLPSKAAVIAGEA